MGRSLQRNDTFSEHSYPGCIAGILKILDYHHWHVKRLLPHKKHARNSRNRNVKVIMERRDLGVEQLIDADSEPLLVEHHETDNSGRAGITWSNFPSVDSHGSWVLSFPLNSWLQRTNPSQYIEASETCQGDIDTNEKSPFKNDPNKDSQVGKSVDVLEIFKVNKEFFMKILQDPKGHGSKKYLQGLKNSNIKVRLGKSKSFPMPQPPKARPVRPTTLKNKQNEVLLFLKKDELPVKDPKKVVLSKGFSGSHGWNQMVVRRFRDIKRKIKRALKESKREESTEKEEEEESSVEATEVLEGLEVTIEDDDVSKPRAHRRMRRTSSLTESFDRYTRLFDDDVSGTDAAKYTKSRSLRLASTSEEEKLLSSRTRKAYKRNLSLPDLDSLSSFLNAPRLSVDMERSQSLANIEECKEIEALSSHDDTRELARANSADQEDKACAASYPEDRESAIEACFSDRFCTREGSKLDRAENQDLVFAMQILELLTFSGYDEAGEFRDKISAESCEAEQHRYGLLFDLVNEVVMEMNERSYGYFPRRGREGLMEEIWVRISWYMDLRPEMDGSLDDVVARDMATEKGDWKGSEWEREMVALEMEDLVFDHLLDELLCSLD